MSKPHIYYKIFAGAIFLTGICFLLHPVFSGQLQINPILVSLGAFQLHWYGLTMAAGVAVALWISSKLALEKENGLDLEQFLEAATWMILAGFVGARLLFVALKWPDYAGHTDLIWRIDQGGLSLHGALLGGLSALIYFARRHRLSWLAMADVAAVGLPVGQIIGRVGNFINQEAFGGPTNLPWKMFVLPENRPLGYENYQFFHPTFLYEAVLLVVLYLLLRKMYGKRHNTGQIFLVYLAGYSVIRFACEFFRVDSDHWGILSVAQWASLAVAACVIIYYYSRKTHS